MMRFLVRTIFFSEALLRHASIILLVALAILCLSGMRVQAAPGDLDPTFGSGGKVITPIANEQDAAYATALQPDGKILAAGYVYNPTTTLFDFALVRHNTNGTLDSNFGIGGKVTTDFFGYQDIAYAIRLQPDGKILVAGYSTFVGGNNFALARYNTNGTLDSNFGNGGKVSTDFFGGEDIAYALALQPDGRILVAGYATGSNGVYDFALVRYTSTGTLDETFGTLGKVTTDLYGSHDQANAMVLQPDGKIILAGYGGVGNSYDFALVRYHSNGTLDTAFGIEGKVTTDFSGRTEIAYALLLQPDGKIVAAGYMYNDATFYDFALARYESNGVLDSTFDGDGRVTTDFFGGEDIALTILLQANGKIVVAGYCGISRMGYDFALARYESNGTLDATFGSGGKVNTDTSVDDIANAMVLQADGRLVVAGYVRSSATSYDFAVARYFGDPVPVNLGDVLISEFRTRGPNGLADCFVEIYNNTNVDIIVNTTDGSNGWALVSTIDTSTPRFVLPNNTLIPARGHYLAGGSSYSLSSYAAKDSNMSDIGDNQGIALFKTSNAANFTLANRLDAVGFSSETNTLYKEGTGLPDLDPSLDLEQSFTRRIKISGGAGTGLPIDENNNATDFLYVDTAATPTSAGRRLGAPGPENLSSPIQRNAQIRATLLDPAQGPSASTNRRRYRCTDADAPAPCNATTSPQGFLSIRRTYTNLTGQPVTRLRFRVVDITTYPEGSGASGNNIADLRALSRSGSFPVPPLIGSPITVRGLTLEQPPNQPYGGGFNSSLAAPTVTLQTPLSSTPPNNKITVEFLLGIVQTGNFRFFVNVEALP